MPDLSSLPPEFIGPLAFVFALALFVSKVFDILEKWRSLRSSENTKNEKITVKGAVVSPPINKDGETLSNDVNEILSAKEVFLFSFFGAIAISILSTLMQFIFIDASEFMENQLYNLAYSIFYGLVSAIICTFFIKNKFPLIAQNRVVTILMGFGVSALLSMPVATLMTIVHVNKLYG